MRFEFADSISLHYERIVTAPLHDGALLAAPAFSTNTILLLCLLRIRIAIQTQSLTSSTKLTFHELHDAYDDKILRLTRTRTRTYI